MENKNVYDYNIENLQVGNVVKCQIELGHDVCEYEMVVTCVDEKDFEQNEEGKLCLVAFGEGHNQEDKDFVEEEAGCRIDGSNFICIVK